MELVIIILMVIAGLAITAFLLQGRWKKPTLEDVRLHYGEKILFDNDECSLEVRGGAGACAFSRVFVRVTDKRIIIGQRIDGRARRHLLKYVIYYMDHPAPKKKGVPDAPTGYVVFKTEPGKLSIQDGCVFRIEPIQAPGSALPECLEVKNLSIEDCRAAFGI